jgi:zinc and cadmium transporter
VHAFTYLNLIGDGFHNFLDGLVIAGAFCVSVKIGIITTIAVVFHEIPQELGDFGVLIYGGFTRVRALFFNFLSGLTSMLGALVGYFLVQAVSGLSVFFLALTAGGFLYVASSDLIPELHKQKGFRRSTVSFLVFVAGLIFMWVSKRMGV